jgi:hypothetical protein
MRHPGIGGRKKLKEEIAQFKSFVKVMKGEKVEKTDRKVVRKKDNILA